MLSARATLASIVRLYRYLLIDDTDFFKAFDEANFVTCTICEDYDLCIPCHVDLKHGHHPSHRFEPTSKQTNLDAMATKLCAPGRGLRHFAICDGCDKV